MDVLPVRALVSVSEYLSSDYSPDVDYVDGELEDRNMGEYDHGRLQYRLGLYFGIREARWGVKGATETRVQVRPTRFRVPDLLLISADQTPGPILTHPPILCVEILSPEDRMTRMQQKIADYLDFGVRAVWVIDPKARTGLVCTPEGMKPAADGILRVAGTPIEVPPAELWD